MSDAEFTIKRPLTIRFFEDRGERGMDIMFPCKGEAKEYFGVASLYAVIEDGVCRLTFYDKVPPSDRLKRLSSEYFKESLGDALDDDA